MSNKEIAQAFLKLASAGKVQEAFDKYVAPDFIHHNPYFKGDRQSLLTAMAESSAQEPNKSFEIKRALEDGDTVATHSLLTRADPTAPRIAVVHIFRFQTGRIVELWDLAQLFPEESPNQYGMF